MNLVKKIQENIFRYKLIDRGKKIVAGVSGGPDSVCLLDILSKLRKKYDLELIVAHVNYKLRKKDSDKDEQFVNKMAKKYNLPIEKKIVTHYTSSITEKNLRDIRYAFFDKVCKKYKADAIAVAHNLNDQAETVLMRILRGTGLRGLSAIKFKNQNIIRPLLNISRKEIFAYLRSNQIPYRIDKTNFAFDFTRNKIRNSLIPYIEQNFNPNIQEILYKLSQSANADYDFIRRYAKEWLNVGKSANWQNTSWQIKVSALNSLHPALQREVLYQAIEKINSNLRDIEAAHIEEILKILKSLKNKRQNITLKGLKIVRFGDTLTINKTKIS